MNPLVISPSAAVQHIVRAQYPKKFMAISVKMSVSGIRPFVLSFGRHNCLVTPCSIGMLHQDSLHKFSCMGERSARLVNRRQLACNNWRYLSNACSQPDNSSSPVISQTLKSESDNIRSGEKTGQQPSSDKPTQEQLEIIVDRMTEHLPKFFKVPHDFHLYNRNVVFEDNIRNVRTVGLNAYAWQIALIKMGAHFNYGRVSLNILKITSHIENGTVRVRWRIVTYPGNSIVFAFWRFKLWKTKESYDKYKDEWIDGFSIFQVGGDGLIHKHICDKVIPDTDQVKDKKDPSLAIKLAIMLGLVPGENLLQGILEYL